MKWFHNGFIGKIVVLVFAVAMHGLLAAGAYFVGEFLGSIIFADQPLLITPFAIGYALAVFVGAMWTFIYSEYAREDVKAYAAQKSQSWYVGYFYMVLVAVMGSELAGITYRAWHTIGLRDQVVVVFIGICILAITYALGKVLHAIVNSPLHVGVVRAINEVGREIINDAVKNKKHMTAEEKKKFVRGDMSGLSEATRRRETEQLGDQQMKLKSKEQEQAERRLRKEREQATSEIGERYAGELLGYEDPASQYPFMQAQAKDLRQARSNGLGAKDSRN